MKDSTGTRNGEEMSILKEQKMYQNNWTLGMIFLGIATLLWGGTSVLQKYLYNEEGMNSPFFVTYISTGIFALFLPMNEMMVRFGYQKRARTGFREGFLSWYSGTKRSLHQYSSVTWCEDSEGLISEQTFNATSADQDVYTEAYTHWQALSVAMAIAPIWFFANLAYNYSLYMTTISSSTILSNLAASFTLGIGWCAGVERITYEKIAGIIISFLGCAIVAWQDDSAHSSGDDDSIGHASHSFAGDVLSIVRALMAKLLREECFSISLYFVQYWYLYKSLCLALSNSRA